MIGDKHNNQPIDMLILSVPWWDMFVMPCGPAVLKGIAESHGYNLRILDCNSILKNNFCNNDQQKYFELESYFCYVDATHSELVDRFYNKVVDTVIDIAAKNTVRYVAFSVFSVHTQKATFDLIQRLKSKITVPIVVGGRGLSTKSNISIHDQLSTAEKMINFVDVLKKRKLVDYAIEGDGEDAIVDLLSGKISQTIDSKFTAKSDSLEYPFSNFDDYKFDEYKLFGKTQLPVVSSKGCVRSCDFCDVGAQMKKFQSKNGVRLAEEMIFLSKKYHTYEFASADSIANGNLKELKNTVDYLVNYNNSVPTEQKISWTGNWICRPRNSLKPQFFDLLKHSGCKHVSIGAEHGSDQVLTAMNKKTNVDGFFYEVEQIHRVGMQCGYNSIVGHWSEYYDDFIKLIEMWLWTGPYIANRTITSMALTVFSALDNTPASDHTDHNQLTKADDNFTLLWYTKLNPTLTLKTRLMRYLTMLNIAVEFNMPVSNLISRLNVINSYISNDEQIAKYNDFFEKNIDTSADAACRQSIELFNNVQHKVNEMTAQMYPTVDVVLTFVAKSSYSDPCIQITHNSVVVYEKSLAEGTHTVNLKLPNDFENKNFLEFAITNKNPMDTIVDDNGNIVKDKYIQFQSIEIDKVDVLKTDVGFFYNNNSSPGLYKPNDTITIEYQAPFWKYFIKNTTNYSTWDETPSIEKIDHLAQSLKSKLNQLKY
jgi:radical SAM superfamily enzyme YgiQ (UPF0313 family)